MTVNGRTASFLFNNTPVGCRNSITSYNWEIYLQGTFYTALHVSKANPHPSAGQDISCGSMSSSCVFPEYSPGYPFHGDPDLWLSHLLFKTPRITTINIASYDQTFAWPSSGGTFHIKTTNKTECKVNHQLGGCCGKSINLLKLHDFNR